MFPIKKHVFKRHFAGKKTLYNPGSRTNMEVGSACYSLKSMSGIDQLRVSFFGSYILGTNCFHRIRPIHSSL
jgi:hypothetical protein